LLGRQYIPACHFKSVNREFQEAIRQRSSLDF
jgi:hypothetical protein